MKISDWLKQLSEDQASKYLCWYSIFAITVHFLFHVRSFVIESETGSYRYSQAVTITFWILVWWSSYKREFKAVYFLTIFWLMWRILGLVYLLFQTSTSRLDIYFGPSQYELVASGIFVTLTLAFPLVVSNELKIRAKKIESANDLNIGTDSDNKDFSTDYSLLKPTKVGTLKKKPIVARSISHPADAESSVTADAQRTAEPTKENIIRDINKKFRTGWLAIQFRDDAKQGWEKVEKLPLPQKLHYLKSLSDDPKREVESLVSDLLEAHRKTKEPFNDEVLNSCFKELISVSPEAAGEFKHIVDTLGGTVDPIRVKNIISYRRGKVGKGLIEYAHSLQISLERRWLPDQKFQNLFADEFEEFVRNKSLGDMKEKDAWRLFIEEMYARCNWNPPNPKR